MERVSALSLPNNPRTISAYSAGLRTTPLSSHIGVLHSTAVSCLIRTYDHSYRQEPRPWELSLMEPRNTSFCCLRPLNHKCFFQELETDDLAISLCFVCGKETSTYQRDTCTLMLPVALVTVAKNMEAARWLISGWMNELIQPIYTIKWELKKDRN